MKPVNGFEILLARQLTEESSTDTILLLQPHPLEWIIFSNMHTLYVSFVYSETFVYSLRLFSYLSAIFIDFWFLGNLSTFNISSADHCFGTKWRMVFRNNILTCEISAGSIDLRRRGRTRERLHLTAFPAACFHNTFIRSLVFQRLYGSKKLLGLINCI